MFRCGLVVLHPSHIKARIPQVIKLASKEVKDVLYVDVYRPQDSSLAALYWLLVQVYGRYHPDQGSLDIRLLLPELGQNRPRTLSVRPEAAFLVESPDCEGETVNTEKVKSWINSRYSGLVDIRSQVLSLVDEEPQPSKSASSPLLKEYDEVVLGGTFDHIHNGHRLLLGVACLLCQRKITVGISDGPLLEKKVLNELIQPFEERKRMVEKFIEDIRPGLQHSVVSITDPIGPAGTDPNITCLIVSKETENGITFVNEARQKNGLQHLELHVIDLVTEETCDDIPGKSNDSDKMSSTLERHKLLGKLLKPVKAKKDTRSDKPYVVGLTGGIASGKSAISKRLENLGATTINCDLLGHLAYSPGKKAYHQIIEAFGTGVVASDGTINRKALGPIVFADKSKLIELNNIVWPAIANLVQEKIENYGAEGVQVCVVEAAVLLDAGWDSVVDEVWVSIVPEDEAVKRILSRDNIKQEQATNRIRSQMSNEERVSRAHVVLCSLWEPEYTQIQVERAWKYLQQRMTSSHTTNQSAL